MKIPILITALILSLLFPSTGFAGWMKVSRTVSGAAFYVDFDSIKQHDKYVHWWLMADFPKPLAETEGILSDKVHYQGDCNLFQIKSLDYLFYKESMGQGNPDMHDGTDGDWEVPTPGSAGEEVLETVCDFVERGGRLDV